MLKREIFLSLCPISKKELKTNFTQLKRGLGKGAWVLNGVEFKSRFVYWFVFY